MNVPIDEQYRLAELIVRLNDEPHTPSDFAARVLEEYGMTDPARDTCPPADVLAPWTAEEVGDIR